MNEIKKTSSFAGFLDGYKAGNIANNEISIKFDIELIINQLNQLITDCSIDKELSFSLQKSREILMNNDYDVLSRTISFTDSLHSSLENYSIHPTLNDKLHIIKKIILQLVNLSERTKDHKLSSKIIELGKFLNY